MKYGLIGRSLSHSYSAAIHKKLGCPDYAVLSLEPDELEAFITKRDFIGINVTIPYKKDVMRFCGHISDAAKRIGSINTIISAPDGTLRGDNTDYAGLKFLADSGGINFAGKKVLILGTGGTSLTAQAVARDFGAGEVLVASRTGTTNYDNIYDLNNIDVIINTTPVGMYPNNGVSPVDLSRFTPLCGVIDVVYNPLKTALIQQAEDLSIPCVGGLSMLVHQAKVAEELFMVKAIDDGETIRVYKEIAGSVTNIILIGMPGCGKSSIGKAAAKLLDKQFVDIDSLIEEREGTSIESIFETRGQAYFRALESDIINEVTKIGNQVIATGGGSILDEKNRGAMRQNGRIYYIEAPVEKLAMTGRPLSTSSDALRDIQKVRQPIYEKLADVRIKNNSSINNAADRIAEDFNENFSN